MPPVEERLVKVETTQDEHTRRFDELARLMRETLEQTKATNGAVADLKLWKARMEGARAAMDWVKPLLIATVSGGVVAVIATVLAH